MNEIEEKIYTIAAEEVAKKNFNPALFAKAFEEADGDDNKTIARYIKLRVEQLKEEFEIAIKEAQELEKEWQIQEEAIKQKAYEEEKIEILKQQKKNNIAEAYCLGCRDVDLISKLLYWQDLDMYCHKGCVDKLNFKIDLEEAISFED